MMTKGFVHPIHPSKEEADRKKERYQWAAPGDRGTPRSIPVKDLDVDHEYQRGVKKSAVMRIARDFSWAACGSLIVMERGNGRYYVIDGQQRLEAIRRRGDIKRVQCMVFISHGVPEEARAFREINVGRAPVDTYTRYRAGVIGKLSPES